MGITLRWTVGGERMDYLSEVRSETLSGCSTGHGALGKLVEENQLLREHVAERNAIIETLSKECGCLKADNERLTTGICAPEIRSPITTAEMAEQMRETEWAYQYGPGYVTSPTVEINKPCEMGRVHVKGEAKTEPIVGTVEELVAKGILAPITVGNAMIQPTSLRIELPGGVVITIPQPKD